MIYPMAAMGKITKERSNKGNISKGPTGIYSKLYFKRDALT